MYENKEKTTGIVLLTHGMFGSALLESASMIYGKIENAIAIPLLPDTDMEEYAQRVQSACKQFPNVLLLIDLFGGTPCNELIKLFPTHDWKAVTGLNLPMLLETIACRNQLSGDALLSAIQNSGKTGIVDVAKFCASL